MALRFYYILFLCTIIVASCDHRGSDQEIAKRERAVELREQRVTLIEDDYRTLLKMRDSLNISALAKTDTGAEDSYSEWPESVLGDWNSRMVCRTSRCANYVIGDQRNERWRFYTDSIGAYVQVVNNDEYIRVFEGKYEGQKITLRILNDHDASMRVGRRVELDDISPNIMKGTLVLTGQDNCEAVFSVELTPRAK